MEFNILSTLVWVELTNDENFLKIKETLTRMGVASKKDKKLYQSCHILHKQGKYAIVHFKELFGLDGKPNNFSQEDKQRRNSIVALLEEWDLLKVVDPEMIKDQAPINQIKIVSFKEKKDWELISKYTIGKKRQ